MTTRNLSPGTTILLLLIIIVTFPVWIALGAVILGVIVGIFGAMIGVVAAVFGALVAVIVLPFKLLFGWHSGWHWFPHFHFNGFAWLAIIIAAALIVKGRQRK
jgi:uncharacterized membrane protein